MNASASADVSSNAYNFLSFIQSGVDPRTGSFSCGLSLTDLLANTLSGPSLPVSLSFNPLGAADTGFGKGWSIGLSTYNESARKLTLSSGASYRALLTDDALLLPDKKIQDVLVTRRQLTPEGSELIVEHKSGLIEVLQRQASGHWLVTTLYSAEGQAVHLQYELLGGRHCLLDIRDAQQRLLVIDRSGAPLMTLWPDDDEKKLSFAFRLQNGLLTGMTAQVSLEETLRWQFVYRTIDGVALISELHQPLGSKELISYDPDQLRLPPGAPVNTLPAVSSHTVYPGAGQPAMTREYGYSRNNYLGFGSNAPWGQSGDNLYRLPGDYEYWSTETQITGSGVERKRVRTTTRTYNRYHLLLSETVQQNQKRVEKLTRYHGLAGLSFEDQSPVFELPLSEETRYYDVSAPNDVRTETQRSQFDGHGNLIEKVLPSGITERYEYYPLEPVDGCPGDSFGLVRWLKRKTIIPAVGLAPAPTFSTHFRYTRMPSINGITPDFLAVEQESLFEDQQETPFKVIATEYERDTSSLFFGRITRKTETTQGIASVLAYEYSLAASRLQTQITMTCKDGNKSTRSIWQHALTGQELRTVGQTGVVIDSNYDRLGRKIVETIAPGTPHQAVKTFAYVFGDGSTAGAETITTNAHGAQTRVRLDGMGREISIDVQDLDSPEKPMRNVYSASYDALGQQAEEVRTDWLKDVPHRLKTRYLYDDWGNRMASEGADGIMRHEQRDPVLSTLTQWVGDTGKTVTHTNLFSKEDRVERFDRNGLPQGHTQYQYDGLGRCVLRISPKGHSTRFAYDFADRLLLTRLPDGTEVSKEYVTHSNEDLATSIRVNDYLAGERAFDGLSRVTRQTVGGRTQTYTFDGAQSRPATRTTAGDDVLTFSYEPVLDNQVLERNVAGNQNLAARFMYDSVHGGLLQASSPGNQWQRDYSAAGHLIREELDEEGQRIEARHSHSLNGLPLSYTDAEGIVHAMRYDPICRLAQLERGQIKAVFSYDSVGRVARIDTQEQGAGRQLGTWLEYDDFGREIRRSTSVDGEPGDELIQAFDQEDKLVKRTLNRLGHVQRDEHFQYDARGRLALYECSGPLAACDARDNPILSQAYEFDALDNISQLKTVFVGGENLTTYHYENPDRTQLTQVTNSHPDYQRGDAQFAYDRNGNLLNDEAGRLLKYDELGRLIHVAGQDPLLPHTSAEYRYDALDRLLGVEVAGAEPSTHVYRGDQLATRILGSESQSFIRQDKHLLAQACSKGAGSSIEHALLGTDQRGSVLQSITPTTQTDHSYTAHGHQAMQGGMHSLLGFNGELRDPLTGCYLLGNGYRAYNPVLMRFHSPDSMSPFEAGGVNPYAYCLGDPINFSDPTGHFSWRAIVGIAIAVAAIAITVVTLGTATPVTGPAAAGGISLSTAAAVVDIAANVVGIAATLTQELAPRSQAGAILGYISLGLGIAGAGIGKAAERTAVATTSLSRQGAIKVSNGQALQSFSGAAKLGPAGRNSVLIEQRLEIATQALTAVEYAKVAAEQVEDSVIPYLFPPHKEVQADDPDAAPAPAQRSTVESILRAGGKYVGEKAAIEGIAQFLMTDRKRIDQIRRLL